MNFLLVSVCTNQMDTTNGFLYGFFVSWESDFVTLTADITFVVRVLDWIESLRNHMRLHAHSCWILSRMKPSLNITFVIVKRILHC